MRYLLLFLLLSVSAFAQQARIQETTRTLTTYPYSDPDPVARPGRFYPYFRFDGYTDRGRPQPWKMVELENDYIRLAVMPEIGGKVWGAYEKSQEFPFVYFNHVVKFRDVAMRGAWTSGGIEFNFGDFGHAPTTSTPVDYVTRTNPDGSVSCFIGATDWSSRTTWRVEINLAPDKAYFTTRSWWTNDTPLETSYYHWTNAGFRATGNLEFVFPGTHYIGHEGQAAPWPVDSAGRKLSLYEQNNFGSYKSYHVMGKPTDFYGAYWHRDDLGFGHYSPYFGKMGKKVWVWGLSRQGMIWEKLLSDTDGQYVELQSGRLFNQAAPESMYSPFKHVGFAPYTTDSWTEYWFPVRRTRGLTQASPRGALNLRVEGEWLKIDWMALEPQSDTLRVLDGEKPLLSRRLTLRPMEVFRDSVRRSGDPEPLTVKLGSEIVKPGGSFALDRPLQTPAGFDWQSEYGLLLRGTDLMRQRNDAEAETYLNQAIQKNPSLVPALSRMAAIRYRQGAYEEARTLAGRALAVDTYDPEANFYRALASEKTGHEADVKDGFSAAALSPVFRSGALLRLAYQAVRQRDWSRAQEPVGQSLQANPQNEAARNLAVVLARKQGKSEVAKALIQEQLTRDPLNHAARFEKYLNSGKEEDKQEFVGLIRQELPQETYLELAIHYAGLHLTDEALRVLALAPAHPMVQIWQAHLLDRTGQREAAMKGLEAALKASPAMVFPFRPETAGVLAWAQQRRPDWKWRYYEALLRRQLNQPERAKALFAECGDEPDFMPFYLAKAELFESDSAVVLPALEKAYRMEPSSWRTGFRLGRYYVDRKQPAKALALAETNSRAHPDNAVLGLEYARMLRLNGRYAEALALLARLSMLPAEGATDAHGLFRETNLLYALEQMKARKWKEAVRYLQAAETWPERLGSGEPYFPDNRLTRFLTAYAFDQLKNRKEAEKNFAYLQTYRNPDEPTDPLNNRLSVLAKSAGRDYRRIAERLLPDAKGRAAEVLKAFLTLTTP
ncbi:DUF5107 domain-containing protein [Larkinella soli]|uniref:DUF5107 domain-containing protein n=1 Tax=Larkinella soli TaxID=1770527 RepID=UPI000FFC5C7E|nr:DUF5107 domain-containing protein [Larkinella soli]